MEKIIYIALCSFLLTSCGPQFRTFHTFHTPPTMEGRMCANQCISNQSMCEQSCHQTMNQCVQIAELKDAGNRIIHSLDKNKNKTPYHSNSFERYNCRYDRDYCVSNCENLRIQCHTNCGGIVNSQTRCVSNCEQR